MVPFNLKLLAKFGLSSNCSQKLHKCSLACTSNIFATARMLAFSLTCARSLEISLILVIKERFRLAVNSRNTRSAHCSPSVFSKVLAACKKILTAAHAGKNKHTARIGS